MLVRLNSLPACSECFTLYLGCHVEAHALSLIYTRPAIKMSGVTGVAASSSAGLIKCCKSQNLRLLVCCNGLCSVFC